MTTLYDWEQTGVLSEDEYGRLARLGNDLSVLLTDLYEQRHLTEEGVDQLALLLLPVVRATDQWVHVMDQATTTGAGKYHVMALEPDPKWMVSIDDLNGRMVGFYTEMPDQQAVIAPLREQYRADRLDLYEFSEAGGGGPATLVRRWESLDRQRIVEAHELERDGLTR